MSQNSSLQTLTVHAGTEPYSVDPILFDLSVHHVFQRPLLSTLITEYRVGGPAGQIAESWNSPDSGKTWIFKIRRNLFFARGGTIDASAVALSLNRMAFLLKKKNSMDGFLQYLNGFDQIKSPSDLVSGISLEDGHLVLKFSVAMPNALHFLSFGQYSIVSSDDFDLKSGDWKNERQVNSSGPYSIEKWESDSIILRLRSEYPTELINPRAFKKLRFVWLSKFKDEVQVREGHEDYPLDDRFRFVGHTKSDIRYVRVYGYRNQDNPLSNEQVRKVFRDRLLGKLSSAGFPVTKSFLPLAIDGVNAFPISQESAPQKVGGRIRIMKYPAFLPLYQKLPDLMAETASELGINFEFSDPSDSEILASIDDPSKTPAVHLGMSGTGIVLDRPREDLRFMVRSKEGVMLPDPTLRLTRLIESTDFSLQTYNEIIEDDGLIWPIMHVAGGIWVRSSEVDASLLNPEPPPTDLSLLGLKE